ncbi:hypothetical protein, partial [Daejeonella sp.]|uniref:hypothetical protein n=1 Tax=Daejeonella sp. TaxID=2805397 RepID=UPI0037C1A3B7
FSSPVIIKIKHADNNTVGFDSGDRWKISSTGASFNLSDPKSNLTLNSNFNGTIVFTPKNAANTDSETWSITTSRISSLTLKLDVGNTMSDLKLEVLCGAEIDSDNDGIVNRLDPDSDGDGCSDAKEAGATTSTAANYSFTSAVGTNGLADVLENIVDNGIPNYTTFYINNALNNAVNACVDTDSDGITDLIDIDDDNDGVLDAIESPACFFSPAEWNSTNKSRFVSVSSQLNLLNNNLLALTDGIGETVEAVQFATTTAQSQLNKELLKFSFSAPTPLIAIYIAKTTATQLFGGNVMVQGSNDNSTWTNLMSAAANPVNTASLTTINGVLSLTNTNKFTLNTNLGSYSFYRIYGVATANVLAGIASEVYFDFNNTTYQASKFPKLTCNNDTDGDLKYNHLDLDADGDGCSDAFEAVTTTSKTVNFAHPTTSVGSNGLVNNLETTADNGIYNGTYSYDFALDYTQIACTDTDNDGVIDLRDLDDDNDGVLDTREQATCAGPAAFTLKNINGTTTGVFGYNSVFPSWMTQSFAQLQPGYTLSFATPVEDVALQFASIYEVDRFGDFSVKLSDGTIINKVEFDLLTSYAPTADIWTSQPNNVNNFTGNFTKNYGAPFAQGTPYFQTLNPTGGTEQSWGIVRLKNIPGATTKGIVEVSFRILESNATSGTAGLAVYTSCVSFLDSDGDGIQNRLDLDSDNDGCTDANEAGTTFISTSGVAAADQLSEDVIPGPYGTNGFADGLETSAGSGSYKGTYTYNPAMQPLTKSCLDSDLDGIPNIKDIDDDNDGATDCQEGIVKPLNFASPVLFTDRNVDEVGLLKFSSASVLTGAQQNAAPVGNANGNIGMSVIAGTGTKTGYRLTFPDPISLQITNNTVTTSGFVTTDEYHEFSAGGLIVQLSDPADELQVWNGTAWVDMPDIYGATTIRWRPKVNLLEGGGSFKFLIADASVFDWTLFNNNSTTANGSTINISRACIETDTDGDGKPNNLDLDSDGDGCSDTFEAGGSTTSTITTVYPTGADADGNGLLTTYQNITYPWAINYTSLYNPFAIAKNLADCKDADGDGIFDNTDIDDDNDGTLDAIESPSCFFSAVEWNKSDKTFYTKITSQLTTISTVSNFDWLTDNNGTANAVQFVTATAQSQLNKELFKIELTKPTQLDAIYILKTSGTQIFAATAASLKVQGSNDNTAWTDLTDAIASPANATNVTANGTVSLTNSNKFIITQNAAKYKYYRIYGVATANILAGIASEFYFDVNTSTYDGSVFPKATCNDDKDKDGIFNHHDLDSDNDGCSDALEAEATAITTANFQFTGTAADFGSNGLINSKETVPDNGTLNYTSKYVNALSNNISYCADTDRDGISDAIDLDDDNDGILDDVESPNCFYTENEWHYGKRPEIEVTTGLTMVSPQNNPQKLVDGVNSQTSYDVRMVTTTATVNALGSGVSVYKFNLKTPVKLSKILLGYTGIYTHFNDGTKLILRGSNDGITWTNLSGTSTTPEVSYDATINATAGIETSQIFPYPNTTLYSENANVFTVTQNQAKYQYYEIFWASGGGINTNGYANEVYFDVTSDYIPSQHPKSACLSDTDGDGVLNHKDLDSDGDGCADANEAKIPTTLTSGAATNLEGTSLAIGTLTSTTLTNAVVAGGASSFGANGFADALETSAESGIYKNTYSYETATNKNISACLDFDGDGVPDLYDLDDDNDGILDIVECPVPGVEPLVPRFDLNAGGTPSITQTLTSFPEELWIDIWNIDNNLNLKINDVNITTVSELNFAPMGASTPYLVPFSDVVLPNGNPLQFPAGQVWTYGNTNPRPLMRIKINQRGFTKIYGLDGVNGAGNYQELILVNAEFQQVPINLTGTNTIKFSQDATYNPTYLNAEFNIFNSAGLCDTDGDKIPNQLDLDSDGDGCSDAFEARTTTNATPDFKFDSSNSFGTNGFVDTKETVTDSGVYNSYYPYDYAIDATIKTCSDFDGDTVPDIFDLDDDNDGILDAIESSSCYFSLVELTKPATVSSELFPYDATATYAVNNSIDALKSSYSAFKAGQYLANKEILKFTANGLIAINNLTLDLDFRAISADVSSTFKLQGSTDDVLWDDLSAAPVSSLLYTPPATLVLTNDLQPTKKYKYFRLFGVAGTSNFGGVANATFILSTSNNSSAFPKITCNEDIDADGKPNHQDLDADGDACPDAKEAGVTGTLTTGSLVNLTAGSSTTTNTTANVANAIAAGPYDANGFANGLETAENGVYTGSYTYEYAKTNTISLCVDTDNDGVINYFDIDDDNDGVLDATESPYCFYSSVEIAKPTTVSTEMPQYLTNEVAFVIDNDATTKVGFASGTNWVGKEILKFTAADYVAVSGMSFDLLSWSISSASTSTFKLQGSTDNIAWTDLSAATFSTAVSGNFTINNTLAPSAKFKYFRLLGVAGTAGYGGVESARFILPTSYNPSFYPKSTCLGEDLDGDLIPNHLDLDSDGDSCADAIEAGSSTLATSTSNYPTGSDDNSNGLLNNYESTTTAGTIKYSSAYDFALNNAINTCIDTDSDGIKDFVDIDDDNDGVLDVTECDITDLAGARARYVSAAFHGTIWKGANNTFYVAGDKSDPTSTLANPMPLAITPANGYNYTGTILHAQAYGLNGYMILTTTGLYTWGQSSALRATAAFGQATLPANIVPSEVKQMSINGTTLNLMFLMKDGTVYSYSAKYKENNGAGLSAISTAFTQVYKTDKTPLLKVSHIQTSTTGTFAYSKADNKFYTWGNLIFLGDGSAVGAANYATEMVNPLTPGVSVLSIGVNSNSAGLTYYVLGSDKRIYTVGESDLGITGQGDIVDLSYWTTVKNSAGTAPLTDVDFLSTQYADDSNESASAILTNGQLLSWGSNSASMIGVGPVNGSSYLPQIPLGITASTKIIAVANGGHITPIFRDDMYVGNIGHNVGGAFGDGTTTDRSYYEFKSFVGELDKPCVPDLDGDGIPNRLDLDSDNDGCSDAKEAGSSTTSNTTSYPAGSDTNSNGLLNDYESTTTAGTINYTSFYSILALKANLYGCTDTDRDGVSDVLDIDDDNDGILDNQECYVTCETPIINGGFESNFIPLGTVTILGQELVPGWSTSNDTFIELWGTGYTAVPAAEGNAHAELNAYTVSTFYQKLCVPPGSVISWSVKHRGRDGVDVAEVQLGGSLATAVTQVVMSDGNTAWGTYTGTYSIPADQATTYIAFKSITPTGTTGNFIDDVQVTIIQNPGCDTDGDGIVNSLDLDSDGDGCSDAIEGGSSLTATSTSVYPSGTDTNVNGLLNNYESSTAGSVNYASTYSTYALSANANACLDTDNDGIKDLVDIDDDNDGVLDAVESPSCFYQVGEVNSGNKSSLVKVSSQLEVVKNNVFEVLTDGIGGTTTTNVQFISTPA